MTTATANSVHDLSVYLETSLEKYRACLDSLPETIQLGDIVANIRFHHLKFDPNGEPKFKDLAKVLADHIVEYCFSLRRRQNPQKPHEFSKLNREARNYIRDSAKSGEAGEMLLYLFMEAVLSAPQFVAKMELKTNPNNETYGSDGIHMKWDASGQCMDIYFGESKLEQSIYSALDNMIASITSFHEHDLQHHELGMVTGHYKYADDETKAAILQIVDRSHPATDCRFNHACLVGYDWDEYKSLSTIASEHMAQEFRDRYAQDLPRIHKLIEARFKTFSLRRLRFEIFVLPFRTVQEFRDAFLDAL